MVASVWTLKNTQSSKRARGEAAAPAIASGPASQYNVANRRFVAKYPATIRRTTLGTGRDTSV